MAANNHIIIRDPQILGGTPVFRGTRVPFQSLLDYLEGGQTLDEFLDDFPTVTREAAVQALEHAGKNYLRGKTSPKPPSTRPDLQPEWKRLRKKSNH